MRAKTMILVGGCLAAALLSTAASGGPIRTGTVFPDFSDTDYFAHKPISLKQFRGKVVVVDFWATWCGPCVAELPNVKRVYAKYHDKGLEIISISLDSQLSRFERFVKQRKMSWHHIADGKGWNARLAQRFGVSSIPAMFVIGRDGRVVSVRPRGSQLADAVRAALKQPAPGSGAARDKAGAAGNPDAKPAGKPAKLSKTDRAQATRWLQIADGMRQNKNTALAEKYYKKIIAAYPGSTYARLAAVGLKKLAAGD